MSEWSTDFIIASLVIYYEPINNCEVTMALDGPLANHSGTDVIADSWPRSNNPLLLFFSVFLEKDVGISIGAVVLVAVFIISSILLVRLARRPRSKPQPVIQVLQLDDVARNYLDNIGGRSTSLLPYMF